ncbi:SdrD B-like domain-containing protein [Gemmobacter sp. 24YEA27]|uniref:SdrD B-like domain-containing protein n=1 Tax=Gemmobacter sp. 24YEA27 TaxID=3040672 RepID=UPI0024B347B1|nr:SdrD B-like domain-containing protein [Gemmobacter sp. 24YEA27]
MMRKVTSILGTAFVALGFSAGLASANGLTLNITDTGYDPIPAGGTIQYAVRIQNGGNVREAADTITFAIPAGGVYVGVSGGLQNCTPAPELTGPAAVTCDVPSLAPREQLTGHVLVRTTGSGTLSFNGTIVNAAVNVDQGTTVVRGADLSLELDAPAQVQAGDNVTLTATITNEGPDTSDGATFSLTLPSGLSSNVSLPAGCSVTAGMINCTVPGPIAAGESITLDFTTQVTTDNASNIAVAGSVTGTSPMDPDLSNDADNVSFAVQPGTDVSLGKSRSPSGLIFTGSPVTFTLTPGYAGGAPLEAQISDLVPPNYTITGVSAAGAGWTCPSPVGNAVSCSYSAASPSGADYSAPITITAIAATDTAASGPVVNTAEITSPTDVLTTNNSASDGGADIAVPMFDLVAHKGSPPHALVTVGNQYDWPIWTQNTGNVPFKGRLIFTDHLPAGLRLDEVVVPAGSNWTCNVTPPVAGPADITCYTDDYATTGLPVGGQTPQLNIRTTVLEEGNLTNGLTVGYSGQEFDDRDLSNNTTSTGVGSGEGPQISDLRIEKTVTSTGPYVSGDPVSFRIEIINPGNTAAESVVVTDRLADLYFADASTTATVIDNATGGAVCSVTRGAAFYSDLRCEIATLPICSPGVDCPFIELTVLAGGTGNKSNTAETYSTVTPDPDYTNNSATAPYAVTPRTDVVVEKSASHDEGASLPAGQQLIYTIAAIVPANGLSDAENVTVTDSLPAGLRIVSVVPSQGSCGAVSGLSGGLTTAGSSVVCNLGTIQNGSQHSVTVVTVPSTALTGSAITNSVSVSTTTPEIDSTNNSDAISHQILAPALDLIINKIDSTDPLELGENTVYTVTATNAGPSEAFSVVITDTLPTAGMQLVAWRPMTSGMACNLTSGAAQNAIGGSIVCSAEHLAVNQSLILEVEMTGVARGRWTNNARVTSAEAAYDPQANNVVNETTSVYERADLRVSKTASAPEADLLEGFDWDIVVSNVAGAGIGLAEGVELVDQLPAHMELTGAPVPSLGNCDGQVGGRDVICILPDMPAGSSISIRVPVRVTDVTSSPQIFSNSATVSTLSFDDESNNTATGTIDIVTTQVSGTIWRDFDFNQIRDLPQDSGVSGVSVQLTGTDLLGGSVTRTTTTDAAGNYVFKLLPPGVAYQVSYTIPTGGTFTAGSAYPAGVGGGTASGTQSILGITATTAAPAVTKDFSLIPVPGLALSKSAAAPVLRVDGTYSIEYTFRLQNNSQEPITNVRLRDTLDPLFGTFSGASPAPGRLLLAR